MSILNKKPLTLAAATVAIGALALAGCARGGGSRDAGGDSPGITDKTITLGVTTPLSGTTAGPGTCTVAGLKAYMGHANAEGGIKFGDGKTRKVKIKTADDAYDPQKASSNYQSLKGDVFAITSGLGTPTNLAYHEAAQADHVPQVLVMTGDPTFDDQKKSPWSLGGVPIYQNEGEALGKALAASGKKHTVAVLSQNDDYGKGYVEGFKQGIKGSSNIKIVKSLTYEATDTSVDSQITQLANTKADTVLNAMSVTPLMISSLKRAQSIGWKPSWLLPSNTSSPASILAPSKASNYPGVYSVSFSKAPASPEFSGDADVKTFLSDLKEYADYKESPAFPHCMWSYINGATLEQAFENMKEPTRDSFMDALRDIKDFQAPLMLDGTSVDTTVDGQPSVSSVVVQKYNGKGYDTVEKVD
ncbi:MAG: ABC transporter substrate-binding protein [Galactobacter sp.]